ncbi:hypothetical protein CRYUN_Cryun02cG0082900 [Craigia yunnanensis]
MAAAFLSTANSFLSSTFSPSTSSSCSSSSSSSLTPASVYLNNQNVKRRRALCKAFNESPSPSPALTKRGFSLCFITSLVLAGNGCSNGNAAILEADDDEELLEKVKRDRKKRLERQGVISSSDQEKGYLQDLVYKLSKIGQAIDNNDLSAASSVIGGSTGTDWVKNANLSFSKVTNITSHNVCILIWINLIPLQKPLL